MSAIVFEPLDTAAADRTLDLAGTAKTAGMRYAPVSFNEGHDGPPDRGNWPEGGSMQIRFGWSLALCLLLAAPSQGLAQRTASSFDQLQVLIKKGDTITVRDSNGAESTGKLYGLSAHGLSLVSDGRQREWADTDVSRIFQRKQDSLANGALYGVAGGAGTFGILAAMICSDGDCEFDMSALGALGAYAGMGAGIGLGIDALITRRHAIYERPSQAASFSVAPILSGGRRGVVLSVKY